MRPFKFDGSSYTRPERRYCGLRHRSQLLDRQQVFLYLLQFFGPYPGDFL